MSPIITRMWEQNSQSDNCQTQHQTLQPLQCKKKNKKIKCSCEIYLHFNITVQSKNYLWYILPWQFDVLLFALDTKWLRYAEIFCINSKVISQSCLLIFLIKEKENDNWYKSSFYSVHGHSTWRKSQVLNLKLMYFRSLLSNF